MLLISVPLLITELKCSLTLQFVIILVCTVNITVNVWMLMEQMHYNQFLDKPFSNLIQLMKLLLGSMFVQMD